MINHLVIFSDSLCSLCWKFLEILKKQVFILIIFTAVKELIIGPIAQILKVELEEVETLDEYIDQILPKINYLTDNFHDTTIYTNQNWLDVNEKYPLVGNTLRIFNFSDSNENVSEQLNTLPHKYTHSFNGNVSYGQWSILRSKSIVLEHDVSKELYELCFLNTSFMILKKHGLKKTANQSQYLMLIDENIGYGKNWKFCIEQLFNIYKYNLATVILTVGLVFIVLLIIILSFA